MNGRYEINPTTGHPEWVDGGGFSTTTETKEHVHCCDDCEELWSHVDGKCRDRGLVLTCPDCVNSPGERSR